MNKKLIEIIDLKKSFKDHQVLKGVNLSIFENERLGIIGSNGAGKTTLLKHVVNLLKQDSGEINYNFDEKIDFLREISMQFQDSKMNISITTKNLIKFITLLNKDKIDNNETEKMIEIFGVNEFIKKNVTKLSGGQKQRLNLLLTVMVNSKILILDEFVTGLDIIISSKIIEYIEEKRKRDNLTLIIISHHPDELKNLTDRIVLLKDGVIKKEYNTKDEIFKYNNDFTKFLVEALENGN